MFSAIRGWLKPSPPAKKSSIPARIAQSIRASFDAATPDLQLDRLFENDVNENAFAHVGLREKLVRRVRYETTNNPYLRGMLKSQANDTIGRGPAFQVTNEDPALVNEVETDFQQWSEDIELPEKLRLLVECWKRDGEGLAIFVEWEDSPNDIKVDLVVLEPEQLTSGEQLFFDSDLSDFRDGIRTDDFGRPLEYLIAKKATTDGLLLAKEDYQRIPASDVIHLFTKDRPSQRRGITAYVASLISAALLRSYSYAVTKAATVAANLSFLVHTNEIGEGGGADPYDVIDIEQGAGVVLPDGYQITQLRAQQPIDTYADFKSSLVTEIGRPINLPKHKSANDSSDYNYASVRLDDQTHDKQLDIDRQVIEVKALRKVVKHWLSSYLEINRRALVLLKDTRSDVPRHEWGWDGKPHVDPIKETTADIEGVKHGLIGLHELYYKRKKDPNRELAKAAASLGMKPEEYLKGVRQNLFEPPKEKEGDEGTTSQRRPTRASN